MSRVCAPGIFRLYFYDDMTRPLPLAVSRLAWREPTTTRKRLTLRPSGQWAERRQEYPGARNRGSKPPLNLKLHVKFKADDKEQTFDFTFATYSREP